MQHISIIEPITPGAMAVISGRREIPKGGAGAGGPPQEDYLLVSENQPIFVVADGVTLNFEKIIEAGANYPNPSPAGQVAQTFCEAVMRSAKAKYDSFDQNNIIEVFREASREVGRFNQKIGPSAIVGNPTGFFSATGAFVVIKENKAYWASICDAYVAHFDQAMNQKFMSSGNCRPYAVINGEERMAEQIESGVFDLALGDRLFIMSDGFEHYFSQPDFLTVFKNWDDQLKERALALSAQLNQQDPDRFGHERSLVAIKF
ncbi:MAG: protein phosphatase 2C domain-containing protein [Candidatus Paceibacterota bacterium]|jgi:hypothetical protein